MSPMSSAIGATGDMTMFLEPRNNIWMSKCIEQRVFRTKQVSPFYFPSNLMLDFGHYRIYHHFPETNLVQLTLCLLNLKSSL